VSKGKKGATPVSRSKQLAPAVDIRPTDDDSSSSAADSSAAAVTASPAEEATDSSPSAPVAPAAKRRRRNELEALQDSLTAADSDSAGEEEEESKENQPASGSKPLAPNNGAVACTIAYQLDEGGVPVFRPTWDEFHDFARFIEEANVSARTQTAVARAFVHASDIELRSVAYSRMSTDWSHRCYLSL